MRQPVHTVYGGAHLFKAATAGNLGALALKSLATYAPGPTEFAAALGICANLAAPVYSRVIEKLTREPVEDYRLDFEDGYGHRPAEEEDRHALQAAAEVANGASAGTLPPFIGIRIKPLTPASRPRAVRTLDLFLNAFLDRVGAARPPVFLITLPKVTAALEVQSLAELLDRAERAHKLPGGYLKVELMVETPQSLFGSHGGLALPDFVQAAQGRCHAVHFGAYDYTAALDITAAHQTLDHPACDFARNVMQVSLAGRGVLLSDGAFNVLPIGPYRGASLTLEQLSENGRVVHRAWRTHFEIIQRSLRRGFYQGWDLHPAQLPARYAAVYAFFLEALPEASTRLRNFMEQAAQATRVGDIFDDAATGQGLLNFFRRGLDSGALTEADISGVGISRAELNTKSFDQILEGRLLLKAGARSTQLATS